MAPSSTKDTATKGTAPVQDESLPERLAHLCEDESNCLTRTPGKGEVKPRQVDPKEKPRTAGARTAGG